MALHPHQSVEGNRIQSSRTFASFVVAMDGTLNRVRYDSDLNAVNNVTFDLKINGVSIYPTLGDRPEMLDGTNFIEQVENESVVKGDRIELSVSLSGSFGSVGQKLAATLYVEDGFPSYFGGTSATSFSIGTGSKAFTTQSGLAYVVGSRVRVASSASPATTYMEGVITAYGGTTLTVLVDLAVGAGTHTDWLFSVSGERGATGATGSTGATGADGADGADGVGVPAGGTVGQVLAKNSGTDYDTEWVDQTGGSADLISLYHQDFITSVLAAEWRHISSSAGTAAWIVSEQNHPGILRVETASGINAVGGLAPEPNSGVGVIHPADMFDVLWLIRPVTNDANCIYRVGMFQTNITGAYTDAILLHKEAASSAFKGECRASSTQSQTAAFTNYTANTWVSLRIRRIDASTIGFTYNSETEKTLTTNIPTAVMVPAAYVVTTVASMKAIEIDMVQILVRDTGRIYLS